MRKITAGLFVSLDGVSESPKDWRLPFDAQTGKLIGEGVQESDAILLGRDTYLEFADFWPTADPSIPMTSYMNDTTKYVVSNTLEELPWANSVQIKGDVAAQIAALKEGPGRTIQVPGSPGLVAWLVREGLLDELTLMVQPVAVGRGRRLFENLDEPARLDLVRSTPLDNGVIVSVYRPARA